MFERLLAWLVDHLVGLDREHRAEVRATTLAVAAERGRGERVLELISLGGLALQLRGRRALRESRARVLAAGGVLGLAVVLASVAVAAVAPPTADVAIVVVSGGVIPTALVTAGWFDPRYAAAAGVIWTSRFLSADLGDVPHAVGAVVGDLEATQLLGRLVVMASGVIVAAVVMRSSLRRLTLV